MSKLLCSLFLSFCLSCLACVAVTGQAIGYGSFDNIRLDTEASVVNCFLQDGQGMIWIGSDKGLFSYDGYTAQARFSFNSPYSSWIYCGVRGGDTLYLGADKGMLKYNTRTDRYETLPSGFPKDIRALAWQGNTLWIGTLGGLYRYTPDTGTLVSFDTSRYPGLPHPAVYSLLCTHDGQLYVGTYNGLCRYLPAEDRFLPVGLPAAAGSNNQFVNSLLEDTLRGCIWIGTEGSLLRYDPSGGKARRIPTDRANSVKSLALDAEQRLLIGTDNGLYIYKEDEITAHSIHDSRNPRSLANNIVWTIFCDREKNSWLGTNNGFSLVRHNNLFHYIPIAQITGTGEGNQFYTLYKDSRGYFWLGGSNGLIRTGNPGGDTPDAVWYKMNDPVHNLSHNRIRHMYEDRDRRLWMATDGSVNRYDYARRQFIRYNIVDSTGRYNANWAYHLFEDEAGKLWIATYLGGIFVVDKEKLIRHEGERYVADFHYTRRQGLSGLFVNQLLPDRSGHVWALLYNSGDACINKIDTAGGRITPIATDSLTGSERPGFLLCDEEGLIWAGYRGGVLQIDPTTDHIRMIPFGAFGRYEVLFMAEVEQAIWVSTSNGFWIVDKQTLQAARFSLTNRAFTSMYYDKAARSLYMGEIDGLALFSPDTGSIRRPDRPLLATALYINGRIEGDRKESIRYGHRIVLHPGQNNFMLEFSDLPYSLEEKNKFVYRLDGLDRDWNLLETNTNRITYTNLAYGRYRLFVAKLEANGQPSGESYEWDIVVEAPWYNTSGARAVYFLLAAGLLFWAVHFFRLRSRLRREHLEKEKILEQSRQKMDFFTNLSHDFKTPLSLIMAPVSKLLPEVKNREERKLLEGVQRNAIKLNALVHQILDVDRMESHSDMLLILSRTEFVSLARNLCSAYAEAARERNIQLLFEANLEAIYLDVDVIKWESILNNLLSNALKYTPKDGTVRLSVACREESRQLTVAVSDTGVGIPEKDLPYIFQRFFQSSRTKGKKEGTGIGLYLVKTYAELHGAEVRMASEVDKGTTVTLTLPLTDPDEAGIAGQPDRQASVSPVAASGDASSSAASIPSVGVSSFVSLSPGGEAISPVVPDSRPLILVVDDDPEIAAAICDMLGAGYRCRTASDGKGGLKLCLELRPDLVITDLVMPGMDGIEMCRHIKKHVQTAVIPLILLTGKSDKETELASIQLHIDAFIPKPFEAPILLSRVEQLLSNKQIWEAKTRLEAIAEPKNIEAVSPDEKFLADITRLIEDHVSDSDLNVNALCELSGVSNKQMYRKIKQFTGQTPVEYIKSIRMKKAAMLLEQRKFTVAEVMYMVGFSSSSYFSKCFQAEFGVTPKQFAEPAGSSESRG